MPNTDYSKLALQGDGWHQETFCLALVAAGRALGVETDYETLCARSTHAFAPAVDFINDCKALLQCQGWLGPVACPIREAAASVGLHLERLDLPPYTGAKDDVDAKAMHQRLCRERVQAAIAAGQVVITTGGWERPQGELVEPWFAGVLTVVRDDGTVLGAHPNGRSGIVSRPLTPGELHVVSRLDQPSDLQAMHRRMLHDAVLRIRSQPPFAKGSCYVFGFDAMDELIRIMADEPGFCVTCQQKKGNGWTDACNNANAVLDRSRVAARYLRKSSPEFPAAAGPYLAAAAGHYDRIVALLHPAVSGEGGPHYRDFVGDLAKQKAHADAVLRPIRTELGAAADEMEKALAVMGKVTGDGTKAQVRRDGNRIWLTGVPDAKFDIHWDMLVRAMETLLGFRGEKTSREELLAYSGDAFNLCHGSHWQGVAYLCIPTDPVGNLAAAYGYDYEIVNDGYDWEKLKKVARGERVQLTQKTLDRVRAEIDAGRPVLMGGAEDHCGSWSLVVGYDREEPLLCHVGDGGKAYRWTRIRGIAAGAVDENFGHWNGRYRGTVRPDFVGGWQSNPAYLIKAKKPGVRSQTDNDLSALRRAVVLHRAPPHHIGHWGGVDYCFGAQAYEQWAQDLQQLDYPADLSKPQPNGAYDWYELGNMDMQVDQIVTGRTAAAVFCAAATSRLPQARTALQAAAAAYRREVEIAQRVFAPFIPRFNGHVEPRRAWLGDGSNRVAGAAAIRDMLAQERLAITAVEQALGSKSLAG